MTALRDITRVEDAYRGFSWDRLWELFDGTDERLNIAHECLDRHPPDRIGARIAYADGRVEECTFGDLSTASSRFAHLLADSGIMPGDRVGISMEPSPGFYTALFGTVKFGAVAVPLYTLFGPDALRDRLDDCDATLLVVDDAARAASEDLAVPVLRYDDDVAARLSEYPDTFECTTGSRDLAVLQYTSGTSRQMPEAVPHDHRSIVTVARAALFGLGIRADDRYFCPSSPAWGHGLWHGTISPWAFGVALGAWSGKFDKDRLIDVLRDLRITNLAAASTVYRMILASGRASELSGLRKASYTGEELDADAQRRFREEVGVDVCGMYGTTETGVIIVNFPGFEDHTPKPGALGKPMPGCNVTVLTDEDAPAAPNVMGEIAVRRGDGWFRAKDLGSIDNDGYFHYGGRADDIIISSGWTISPLEVERTLRSHPAVDDAAVIGVPDDTRGQVVRAYVVADGGDELAAELQQHVRSQLSPHEYPRQVVVVAALPRTKNGKIDRRALRIAASDATEEEPSVPTYAALQDRVDAPAGSAWGVFGPGNDLGTVNHLTPERVTAASGLVKRGAVFGLDYPLDAFAPGFGHRSVPTHTILKSHDNHRDDFLDGLYLQISSHMDGLRHIRHPVHGFYNGHGDADVAAGTPTLGIQAWGERGIAGRGVLLDVERYLRADGRPIEQDAPHAISVDDLEATAAWQGTTIEPGDILLVRTGWAGHVLGPVARVDHEQARSPGLEHSEEILAWLWDRNLAVVASDNLAVEAYPPPADSPFVLPFESDPNERTVHTGMLHRVLIPLLGMALGELWHLDELARDCEADGIYESLVVAKPMVLPGGVGSPANAVALK